MSNMDSAHGQSYGQFDKFWKNYYATFNWNYQHQIAYLQSQVKSLEYENSKLQEYIHMFLKKESQNSRHKRTGFGRKNSIKGSVSRKSKANKKQKKKRRRKQLQNASSQQSVHSNSTYGGEIDSINPNDYNDEFCEFYRITEKHRRENREKKAKETRQSWENICDKPFEECAESQQLNKMKNQYGKFLPKIIAMETAVQLTFDRICDTKMPPLWPTVPFKATD